MLMMLVLVMTSVALLNICVSNAVGALRSWLLQATCVGLLLSSSLRTAAEAGLCGLYYSTCHRLAVLLTIRRVGMHAVHLDACHSCVGVLEKISYIWYTVRLVLWA